MSYKIKLDIFEGPFDLLVYLIESARMNVYDIQVSAITNQYIKYVEGMKTLDVNLATEFMVLAAELIEIKSKMLLPRLKADGDGVIEEDPRTELVQRILEYKRFKAAAELLELQEEQNLRVYVKPKEDLIPFTKEPDEILNLDLNQFVKTFHVFLLKKKRLEDIKRNYARVERQKISVETRIEYIRNMFRVKDQKSLNFKDLLTPESNRYEVVLTFSSMLEMIRQRVISVKQNINFGEIYLSIFDKEKDVVQENPEEGESVS